MADRYFSLDVKVG